MSQFDPSTKLFFVQWREFKKNENCNVHVIDEKLNCIMLKQQRKNFKN